MRSHYCHSGFFGCSGSCIFLKKIGGELCTIEDKENEENTTNVHRIKCALCKTANENLHILDVDGMLCKILRLTAY
jgi:hypothetical protein